MNASVFRVGVGTTVVTQGGREVRTKGETRRVIDFAEFVETELSKSLGFLSIALNDRSAGDVTAAKRDELAAYRAFHDAVYLFTVLRSRISEARARRLAVRIREFERAVHGG
ncbi:MAG TPA: hypothetical protein VG206_14230 [Terriglobia bacterium]|nr:hypothetical protein [Terriglobia bacterium]